MQESLSRFVVAVGFGGLLCLCTTALGAENQSIIESFNSAVRRAVQALHDQRYAEALSALDDASRLHPDGRLRCKYAKAYLGLKRAQAAEHSFIECLEYLKKEDSKDVTDELRRELESDLQRARELQASQAAAAVAAQASKPAAPPVATIQSVVVAPPVSPGVVADRLAQPAAAESPSATSGAWAVTPANVTEERMRVRARRRVGLGVGLSLACGMAATAAGLGWTAYAKSRALTDSGVPAYDDFRMQSQTIRAFATGADVAIGAALLTAALTVAIAPNWPRERYRSVSVASSQSALPDQPGPAAAKLVATK